MCVRFPSFSTRPTTREGVGALQKDDIPSLQQEHPCEVFLDHSSPGISWRRQAIHYASYALTSPFPFGIASVFDDFATFAISSNLQDYLKVALLAPEILNKTVRIGLETTKKRLSPTKINKNGREKRACIVGEWDWPALDKKSACEKRAARDATRLRADFEDVESAGASRRIRQLGIRNTQKDTPTLFNSDFLAFSIGTKCGQREIDAHLPLRGDDYIWLMTGREVYLCSRSVGSNSQRGR